MRLLSLPFAARALRVRARFHAPIAMLIGTCCVTLCDEARAQVMAVDPPPAPRVAHAPAASTTERLADKPWILMDLGLSGVAALGDPTLLAFGIHLIGFRLEWPRGAVLLVPHFSRGAAVRGGEEYLNLSVSAGGRYLFVPESTSPFVGGGLTAGQTWLDGKSGHVPKATAAGPGSYIEAGIEFFRSTGYQLSFGARLDTPFFRATSSSEERKVYVAPISIEATISVPWQALGGCR